MRKSIAILSAALALTLVSQAEASNCELNDLKGTYAVTGSVTLPPPGSPLPYTLGTAVPVSFQNITTFDKMGNLVTPKESSSTGGLIEQGVTGEGTYTINADCTGTLTVTSHHVQGDRTLHADMIVLDNGRRFTFIITDTGVTGSGTGERIR